MKAPVLGVHTTADGSVVKAFGGLHHMQSNRAPYFSLTKEEYNIADSSSSSGADHDTIVKNFPELADLAALHLSNIDGVPLHAEANGWYHLAGALPNFADERFHVGNSEQHFPKPEGAPRRGDWDNTDYRTPTPDEALQIFAKHVRVSVEIAEEVRDTVAQVARDAATPVFVNGVEETRYNWKAGRVWFSNWIEQQKPRWKQEAEACIAHHDLTVYGDPWKETK